MADLDPTVARRKLKNQLRTLREAARLSQSEVATELDWSLSKIIRIEAAKVSLSVVDTRALLDVYGVSDPDARNELLDLARASRTTAWYHAYRGIISTNFAAYLGHESSSSVIRNFQPAVIPGLLQTEDYARQLLLAWGRYPDQIEQHVDLRMERQLRISTRDPVTRCSFIFDECAVRRIVGGHAVMREQLQRLLALTEQETDATTIRILPFEAGFLPRTESSWVLLEIPSEEGDILYREDLLSGEIVVREGLMDHPLGVSAYLEAFFNMAAILDPHDARAVLLRALHRLDQVRPKSN